MDRKAQTQWLKASISYDNYQNYINNKTTRYSLSIIDLLYISNFKGGNASIHEHQANVDNKLLHYSGGLARIEDRFNSATLSELNQIELLELKEMIISMCQLTHKGTFTKIDGFSTSYLSALLNAYFPRLIPILDRRVLINLALVGDNDIDNYGQIKNIEQFYGPLINKFRELCTQYNSTVRQIDRVLFITKLGEQPNFTEGL